MSSKSLAMVCLLIVSPLSLAADTDVVARMGDISLTVGDVRLLTELHAQQGATAMELQRLLRTELVRRGLAEEARRQQFDKRPEVSSRMAQAADQALVAAYVNSIARPAKDYPSEQQSRQAYEANREAFKTTRQFRVSQIYVAGTDDKARKEAEELHRQASRKRADFAAIARKSSQHAASAARGGDMGWLSDQDLMPAVRMALTGIKKGEIGGPVQGQEGFHILLLADIKEPEILPFEKVKDTIAINLRLRKAREIETAYLDGMLAKSPIAVNEIMLTELVGKEK